MTRFVTSIREAWLQLHGVLCVYKPPRMSSERLRYCVINNICRDINQLEPQEPRAFVKIEPKIRQLESEDQAAPSEYSIIKTTNLADLELVSGPPIKIEDIRCSWASTLGWRTSGVMIFGINDGNKNMRKLVESRPLSVYQIKGLFGLATDNHWNDGKVFEKTINPYITKVKIDRVLASIQSSNQRNMFDYCGVDPTSQTAYELASKGLLRPAVKGPTLVYSIKCIAFEPPNFTLEIHCINENEHYLSLLVHDLGLSLKTSAVCEQIRCIRYGCFTVEDALLRKHWSMEHFPQHMVQNWETLSTYLTKVTPNFTNYTKPHESESRQKDETRINRKI
nr:EOG090X0AGI [Eurycercus lamellatus]